jgi:hypothetical protein
VRCPDCGAEHRHHATPPLEVYRLDPKGNWEYITTIDRAPTQLREFGPVLRNQLFPEP